MEYAAIKHIHLLSIVISITLFSYRYYGVLVQSDTINQRRWLKIIPHINDTILLVSAIALAIKLGVSPGENSWLMAKIIALLLYIVLGSIALKRGKTYLIKVSSGVLALLTFGYIISVAITKSPLGFLA